MLEIYSEQVRDLLSKSNPKGGLKVRENPKLGLFYVGDLKKVAVGSYDEIDRRIEEGTANRTGRASVVRTNRTSISSCKIQLKDVLLKPEISRFNSNERHIISSSYCSYY